MTDMQLEKAVEGEVVLAALEHLKKDEITDVIACFAKRFRFNDRGIGLEFNNPRRLAEFFRKTREFYPDSSLQTGKVIVSGEHVITEWTLRFTLTGLFTAVYREEFPSNCTESQSCRRRMGRSRAGPITTTD